LTVGEAAASTESFKKFSSAVDKAAKVGVISKNAASRRKARAYAKIAIKA